MFIVSRHSSFNSVSLQTGQPGFDTDKGKGFFSSSLSASRLAVAHPAFCKMSVGGPFTEVKCGRELTPTKHPLSCARHQERITTTHALPQPPPWRVAGQLCF
jgi:hypothetical protein